MSCSASANKLEGRERGAESPRGGRDVVFNTVESKAW